METERSARSTQVPRRDATNRRNYVLARMHQDADDLGVAERHARRPLEVQPAGEQRWKHPYFVDLVLRQLGVLSNSQTKGLDQRFDFLGTTFEERARNVYLRGLRIHTTLDPNAQEAAEDAVKLLPDDLDRISAALAAIEPATGYIRALVGGRDYYPDCEDRRTTETHCCKLAKLNLALGRTAAAPDASRARRSSRSSSPQRSNVASRCTRRIRVIRSRTRSRTARRGR